MRNPLSAIVQSADDVATLVKELQTTHSIDDSLTESLDSIHESAQVILLCAAHQKRIVDDILIVSKLDSNLLSVTPILAEPSVVVQQAMQMFNAEFKASNIQAAFTLENAYDVTWVHCDPSRLTQILVNLLTNAIKFTKTAPKREICLRIMTTTNSPPNLGGIQWYPTKVMPSEGHCNDKEIYLVFEVQDTGKGMTKDEMTSLFGRFAQANPKTHITVCCNPEIFHVSS